MQNSPRAAHGVEDALSVGVPLRETAHGSADLLVKRPSRERGDEYKIARERYQVWTKADLEFGRISNPLQELTEGLLAVTKNERPTARTDAILALGLNAGLDIDDINAFQSARTVAMTVANKAAQLGCTDRYEKLVALWAVICCERFR